MDFQSNIQHPLPVVQGKSCALFIDFIEVLSVAVNVLNLIHSTLVVPGAQEF